jgi:hypothetical protein
MSKTAQKNLVLQLIVVIVPTLEKKFVATQKHYVTLENFGPQFSIINLGNQKSSIAKTTGLKSLSR